MKKLIGFLFIVPAFLGAEVGLIPAGQSMWWISKRIGETADVIDSKLDGISATCEATVLTSADISQTGTIFITESGLYCLSEDVTADILIVASECVSLDLNNRTVTGVVKVDNITDCVVQRGFIEPPDPSIVVPPAAFEISTTSNRAMASNLTITCGTSSTGVEGRNGIDVEGDNAAIMDCYVRGGAGGSSGAQGGHGILITGASDVVVKKTTIFSGDGGTGATGGDGGHGISLNVATRVEIDECTIFSTGDGGTGPTGGDGGNGINIDSSCVDVAVHDCIIRNTGGGGATGGADGKAINDDVASGLTESIIYRNVAHNIANTIRYDFRASGAEGGVSMTNPPTNIPRANQFINFFM